MNRLHAGDTFRFAHHPEPARGHYTFSAFTGGMDHRPRVGERLFAIAGDTVVEVPPPRASRRARD